MRKITPILFLTSLNTAYSLGLGKRFMIKRNKNNTFHDIQRDKPKRTVTVERQVSLHAFV